MESFFEMFNAVKDLCKEDLSSTAFDTWIKPIEPVSFQGETASLFVKSEFQKGVILSQYKNLLTKNFKQIVGFDIQINILTEENIEEFKQLQQKPDKSFQNDSRSMNKTDIENALSSDNEYTFDTFVVGDSNKLAYAACKSVTKEQGRLYNPLFIYGPSGLGKTHLLMAIQYEIKKANPGKNIIYVNSETFTNEFVYSIENKSISEFHTKYRAADILLIDDIQFITGKERTQEEFFYTFNTLYNMDRQIVLTSDRPPKDIKTLEDRLRTRFESGFVTDISAPDLETRMAIIKQKADFLSIELPDDVVEFIAGKLKNNIRQLEGAVKKFRVYKVLANLSPSIPLAQNIIRDILNENQPVEITVEKIISEVARTYSITIEDLKSQKRSSHISVARQSAMYVIREITSMSLAGIGAEFGDRDHATVVYATQKVESRMKKDFHYKEIIEDIIKNIKNS